MVRIVGFKQREKEDGTPFFILELQGGIEMTLSKETGQFYATAKKAYVTSTFDEQTCKALVGSEMPGSIQKKEVEPYTYVVQETGEELILHHRWVFVPESDNTAKEEKLVNQLMADDSIFSNNGVPELAQQAI
ncbi:hypothetical protein [Leeuwenhoekiella nanhaiensis]|uniref:Uncharacterized protein n=1 Tax=Leeuwenhoekiella nanhaiensis TaxID=1655491 RepID=A0A2G1VVZ4_9FLAO|nr:hypothetical protein [Leeuwenhoekiella nanhaiensis]PHQ30891.1 hypothetical protein CJ305_01300 [Leeuwenhoekiella nanhaiensis]